MADIESPIQALPQELQDMILDFLVQPPTHTTISISSTHPYDSPIGLHLDRNTRQKTAIQYFGTNSFNFSDNTERIWLEKQPKEHIALIPHIGIQSVGTWRRYEALWYAWSSIGAELACREERRRLRVVTGVPEAFKRFSLGVSHAGLERVVWFTVDDSVVDDMGRNR